MTLRPKSIHKVCFLQIDLQEEGFSSKGRTMKRDKRTRSVPTYMLKCFLGMQVGVVFLLVAQSFSEVYKPVILDIGILLLVVSVFFSLGHFVWKTYVHPHS